MHFQRVFSKMYYASVGKSVDVEVFRRDFSKQIYPISILNASSPVFYWSPGNDLRL